MLRGMFTVAREASSGDADCQCFGGNLGAQAATVTDHITVELIGVWVPEPHLDPAPTPLIDTVILAFAKGEQPGQHPQPMNEVTR
jgi:hypothetical protein